jgi:Skp family chaperone for outer membrane proteins
MKKTLRIGALAAALLFTLSLPSFGQGRIATISLQKVFDNYWKKAEADAALQEKGAELDKELKGMIEDYRKSRDDFQKLQESASDLVVAAEEREKRKKAAEASPSVKASRPSRASAARPPPRWMKENARCATRSWPKSEPP